jgi:hypothetical protein
MTVAYLLLLDALNFCFWPKPYLVERDGTVYGKDDGYFALAAALSNAFERGIPLWDPKYLARISRKEFNEALCGYEGGLDLMDLRYAHARDVGATLLSRYDGDPLGPIEASCGKASTFVAYLAHDFMSYKDVRTYDGREVAVYKRAQLCAADIAAATGLITDTAALTCFADYKLPQLLRSSGVFVYDDDLDMEIAAFDVIPEGSTEETEIRCCTIHAVGLLVAALKARGVSDATAQKVDYLLWTLSIDDRNVRVPHHRTFSSSY